MLRLLFGRVKSLAHDIFRSQLDGKPISDQVVSEVRAQMHKALLALQVPEVPNRVVRIAWFGHSIEVHVDSAWEECRVRLHAYIKMRALQLSAPEGEKPFLIPLFAERDLLTLPPLAAGGQIGVDRNVLKAYNTARVSALEMLPVDRHCDGPAILETMQASEDVLNLLDDSICLEIAWFRLMVASGAAELLEGQVMVMLPKGAGDHDPTEVGACLDKAKLGSIYKFCPDASKALLNITCEWDRRHRRPPAPLVVGGAGLAVPHPGEGVAEVLCAPRDAGCLWPPGANAIGPDPETAHGGIQQLNSTLSRKGHNLLYFIIKRQDTF